MLYVVLNICNQYLVCLNEWTEVKIRSKSVV